ncbi:MAG TPA: tetratricopeptide repeat protein [Armatimonadota bacterium]|jgi:tetratricopeptide (TPR) repeat protein
MSQLSAALTNRVRRGGALLALLAGAALLGGCGLPRGADRLRQDLMAQSLAGQARAAVAQGPGQDEQAVRLAQWSQQLAPQSLPVLRNAAGVLLQARAWQPALAATLALQERTGEVEAYETGMCYLYLHQGETGARLLEEYVSSARSLHATEQMDDLGLAGVLNNVGYVYADTGYRLREALALTTEAVRLAPRNAIFVDSLGWAYYHVGQYDRAAFYLERALRLQRPEEPELLYHAGVIHARQGQPRLARLELHRALDLRGVFPEAEYELQRMNWQLPQPRTANLIPDQHQPS